MDDYMAFITFLSFFIFVLVVVAVKQEYYLQDTLLENQAIIHLIVPIAMPQKHVLIYQAIMIMCNLHSGLMV